MTRSTSRVALAIVAIVIVFAASSSTTTTTLRTTNEAQGDAKVRDAERVGAIAIGVFAIVIVIVIVVSFIRNERVRERTRRVLHDVCGKVCGLVRRMARVRGWMTRSASDERRSRPPGSEWAAPARASEIGSQYGDDGRSSAGGFGLGGYQEEVKLEDARARAERERVEAERWARWEAEDEERELKRAEKRAEKKAEKKAEKEKTRAKRWVKYDEAWNALEATSTTSATPLAYDDVPWPPKMDELLEREAGGASASERDWKLAYHRCVKRWHPDKFTARFRSRVEAGVDGEKIAERVQAVAKALTVAYARR